MTSNQNNFIYKKTDMLQPASPQQVKRKKSCKKQIRKQMGGAPL